MHTIDERFFTVDDLAQGEKFMYKQCKYMVLPKEVTCYGEKSNAINLVTGTMMYFGQKYLLDANTRILEEININE